MAHFAEVENNIVKRVIVVNGPDCDGGEFPASETCGKHYIKNVLGLNGEWFQTSYGADFRGNFAGIGYAFNGDNFIPPQPYPSWTLDGATWAAPVPRPEEGRYYWDEKTLAWVEMGA